MNSAIVPAAMEKAARTFQYSPGVDCGAWIFISGQVGRGVDGRPIEDPEGQFVAAFENVGAVLAEVGLTFADIVDLTTFHTSFDDFELFAEVKSRYLATEPYPAWTGIGAGALAIPGLLVEIKAVAQRSPSG